MSSNQQEIRELLSELCEDRLDAQQARRLNELLRDDPAARQEYLDYFALHAALRQGAADPCAAPGAPPGAPLGGLREKLAHVLPADVLPAEGAEMSEERSVWRRLVDLSPRSIDPRVHPARFWSISVGITAAVWVIFALFILPSGDESLIGPLAGDGSSSVVAKLVRTVDADWADGGSQRFDGALLRVGEGVELTRGLAQIELKSGTTLLVQAPSQVILQDSRSVFLQSGKLTAMVREKGTRFEVDTPLARIVDLGTEFGVWVDDAEETEVHVFQGAVEVHCDGPDKSNPRQASRLNAGQSTRIGSQQDSEPQAKLASDAFVRKLPPPVEVDFPATLVPVTQGLALWLAADARVRLDADGNVMAWGDIPVGDNQTAQNASQRVAGNRPRWVAGAIGAKPVIRFDGRTAHLATASLPKASSQTFFAVVAPSRVGGLMAAQLFNGNGPPHIVVAFDKSGCPGAWMFAGDVAGKHGDIQSSRPASRPCVLTYVYDNANRRAELLLNGERIGAADAQFVATATSPVYIGKHPFAATAYQGDLAELLLYNRALDSAQQAVVCEYLFDKYQLGR